MVLTQLNQVIHIGSFDDAATAKYQGTFIDCINQITPCSIVAAGYAGFVTSFIAWLSGRKRKAKPPQVEGNYKRFIRFQMLPTYDRSLILLNFIRNLWHEPKPGYSVKFFEALEVSGQHHQDPLARLTWSNKKALEEIKFIYGSPGHSNVHMHSMLKIKTTEQLHAYNGNSTYGFLTGD